MSLQHNTIINGMTAELARNNGCLPVWSEGCDVILWLQDGQPAMVQTCSTFVHIVPLVRDYTTSTDVYLLKNVNV
jgi:hypothetical protein